jgi:tRNA(Ile)-lysidine synthase
MAYGETDVPAAARERRISLEHAARECRYEFLERTAQAIGADFIATGHTADDQLETVLFNVLRGSSIHGLAGMPRSRETRPGSGVRIVRPLIDYTRGELLEFLAGRGAAHVTDRTNFDTAYTRNRIRHVLIPALEESWPEIRADVTDFVSVLGALDQLLDEIANEWITVHVNAAGGASAERASFEVGAADLEKIEEPLLSYVIRGVIADTLGDLRRIDEVHLRMIEDLLTLGSTGASLDLPRGLVVRRGYGVLAFEAGGRPAPEPDTTGAPNVKWEGMQLPSAAEVTVPGRARWGAWEVEAGVLEGEKIWSELRDLCGGIVYPEVERPPADPGERMRIFIKLLREIDPGAVQYLDYDRVGSERLVVRSRRPGDRFMPLGSPGQAKLKDFLIRRKVPRAERDSLPLVTAGERVLAISGLGVCDAAALAEDTRRILKITSVRTGRS